MSLDYSDPTPLYQQIVNDIKNKIESNIFRVGEMIPSQRILAKQYNVSMITVKKAISILINDGILYSRVGKGTYIAQKFTKSKLEPHKTIGLVLSDLKSPFFSLISHGIEMESSQEDYNLLLSNSSGQFEKEEQLIHRFLDMGVEGLIIASMSHTYYASETIRQLHADGYPYVLVSFVADNDIYHVGVDHHAGAYIATKHLMEHGYRKICHIKAEEGNFLGELRYKGYLNAMTDYGLQVKQEDCYSYPHSGEWMDYQSGYEIGLEFIKRDTFPEAVFVYNDLGALGFQSALLENKIKIPNDIAVVGFDDINQSAYAKVPLTTVRQPTERIGQLAVKKLTELINGNKPEIQTILRPQLIVRSSCGTHSQTGTTESIALSNTYPD